MNRGKRYPAEVLKRAVRMVLEHQSEHEPQWVTILSIAGKIVCTDEWQTQDLWSTHAVRDFGC